MSEELKQVIAGMLKYSLGPIDYKYASLTDAEKEIVGSEATFNELVGWVRG